MPTLGSRSNGVIAYTDQDSSGNQNIFLIAPDGTGRTQLTFDTAIDLLPWWSPDGTQLAYVNLNSRTKVSNIYVINADGSNPHQIASQASSPAWSPANTQIAYTFGGSGNTEIWTMAPDGSNKKQLTTSPSGLASISPSFSPDGQRIVYVQFSPTTAVPASLWIMNADGSDQHQLTSGTWNNYDVNGNIINTANEANSPAWGSNDVIVFWAGIEHQEGQIWTINPDGSDRKQLTHSPHPYVADEPEWSPDGTTILYTTNVSGAPATWLMNSDGSGAHLLTNFTAIPAGNDAAWQPYPNTVALASTLNDFGAAQGWNSPAYTRQLVADRVQHDSVYVGFGRTGTVMAWGVPGASPPALAEFGALSMSIRDFGTSQGYDSTRERGVAVYGTGTSNGLSYQQDIVYGQGNAGIYFYRPLSAATQSDGVVVPTYETSPELYPEFGTNQGWTQHHNFQTTLTTHATPDIVGFGDAGMIVAPQAFAPGASMAQEYLAAGTAAIGNKAGWDSLNDVRTILDQNGKPISLDSDGIPDFVGMGPSGLVYAYGSKDANGNYQLGAVQTAHISGSASDLGDAQGWNDATTPRIIVADPNSGYDDIFAFGAAGVYVALGQDAATHGGEPFGQLYLAVADFGLNQGWTFGGTPRIIADIDGDGILDIVGFGTSTTFTDLGSVDAAGKVTWAPAPSAAIHDFGTSQGWDRTTFRGAADISGTGRSDLILSGASGTQIWQYSS